ncbi:MAG: carboxypeptidase-like regulatory domain-containing protein [Patescibacteria group bacterium]
MRKGFIIVFLTILLGSVFVHNSFSQDVNLQGENQTQVQAKVGEFYLDLSGFISPHASVVLNSNDIFLRSIVADEIGNFSMSSVSIKKGFSEFCLTAVDFSRLGESITCFSVPPAQASISMKDIFLPPTLGLSRTEAIAGSAVDAYGYSMPGANVYLNFTNRKGLTVVDQAFAQANPNKEGQKLTALADDKGNYRFTLKNLASGTYDLYATANLQNKDSAKPTKQLQLKVTSSPEETINNFFDLLKKPAAALAGLGLGLLWLVFPIILIIIFLVRRYPQTFRFIYDNKFTAIFRKKSSN